MPALDPRRRRDRTTQERPGPDDRPSAANQKPAEAAEQHQRRSGQTLAPAFSGLTPELTTRNLLIGELVQWNNDTFERSGEAGSA